MSNLGEFVSKKELFTISFLVILVAGVAFTATYKLTTPSGTQRNTPNTEQASINQPVVYTISLLSGDQETVNATLKVGEYIQFDSADDKQHQIKSTGSGEHSSDALDSPIFGEGEGYRVQFKDIGTYELQDVFNPAKKITVTVEP